MPILTNTLKLLITDIDGKRVLYDNGNHGRNLTSQEVKENYDIIPHSQGDS